MIWDINGTVVNPVNAGSVGFRANFGDRIDELALSVDNLEFTYEEYQNVIAPHLQTLGFFEGLPINATAVPRFGAGQNVTVNYYLDFQENPVFKNYTVEFAVKKRKGTDQFWEKADGTSFELINKTLQFPTFQCPYVIVKDNQAELAISMAITLYLMVKETIEATKQLVSDIVDLIGSVTPNVGFGINFDIGDVIAKVLKVIAQLAYVALLLVAVINLSKQLFELIFPKIRYFSACKVKDLLRIGAQYLGYQFSSTLLDSIPGLTLMPKPLQKQSKKWFDFTQNDLTNAFNKGYPTSSDTTPTLGSLLEAIRVQFNGRVRIIGNVVHLERRDYWSTITQNAINPALAIQEEAQDRWTVNVNEAWKRFYIHYQTDISDLHTFDNFEGVDAEYSAEPVSFQNDDLFNIRGLIDVNIPFALGARKNSLNWLEKLVKEIFKTVDKVINTFGGNSSLASKIENRIGVLMISQQYFSTTKMLYTIAGKQPENYLSYIRASQLYNKYHYIDQIELNGFKIREDVPVAVTHQDFVSLLNNNYAEINGLICEIQSFEYIEDSSTMTISYREPYNYAGGKVKTIPINL